MKTISIIVNKIWEVEPVLNAMLGSELRPTGLPLPQILNSPNDGSNKMDIPRAVFTLPEGNNPTLLIEVWCIQDLMYHDRKADPSKQSSSSSAEKYRILPHIMQSDNPDLVIAVGTAGYPSDTSLNGSVVIGSNFFIHDGHPGNPKSKFDHPDFGKVLLSNINVQVFELISKEFKHQVEPRFIRTPRNPAQYPVCIASDVYTAISSVNVTDYAEYNWVDHEAREHFQKEEKRLPFKSLETTHGVIKLSTDKPIIFVSAITDRIGYFDTEVTATQNYVSSFNAGIVLGQLIVSLYNYLLSGGTF